MLKLKTKIILAPLAGTADLSFRLIAREHGAEFCFYEMADANSLAFDSRLRVRDIFRDHEEDSPIAAQILGFNPETMLKGAKSILKFNNKIKFLDINAACPVRKVVRKYAGAYLVKEPEMLYRSLDKLSSSLNLPITVKLRIGYDKKNVKNLVTIAKHCEKFGAQALFVHGRTKAQEYSGDIDYESIKAVKDSVKIPVYGSGNILSPQKAKQMIDQTNCDGILVARGAMGNPWLFRQIKSYLNQNILLPEPGFAEKFSVLIKHIQYVEKYKDLLPKTKLGFARKVAQWYIKGFREASTLRNKINRAQSFEELYKLLRSSLV